MSRPRVLVAGLGDTGLLTAIHLSRHADVVGVSAKPAHVSGQELGVRLTRPDDWSRDYRIANELPTLLVIAIVILVIVKPF